MNVAYRLIGSVLVLAGGAATNFGLISRNDPQQSTLAWAGLGAGLVLLAAGFLVACKGRRAGSRASFGFSAHVATSIMTAGAFYKYHTPLLATVLACQIVVGLIILPCVIEARRRVGPVFFIMLVAYIALLGGSIFVAVKVA